MNDCIGGLCLHWILFWRHFHKYMQPKEEEEGTGADGSPNNLLKLDQ